MPGWVQQHQLPWLVSRVNIHAPFTFIDFNLCMTTTKEIVHSFGVQDQHQQQ